MRAKSPACYDFSTARTVHFALSKARLSRKVLSAVAYLDKEEKNAKKKRHYGQNAVQERFLGPIVVIYGSEKAS